MITSSSLLSRASDDDEFEELKLFFSMELLLLQEWTALIDVTDNLLFLLLFCPELTTSVRGTPAELSRLGGVDEGLLDVWESPDLLLTLIKLVLEVWFDGYLKTQSLDK